MTLVFLDIKLLRFFYSARKQPSKMNKLFSTPFFPVKHFNCNDHKSVYLKVRPTQWPCVDLKCSRYTFGRCFTCKVPVQIIVCSDSTSIVSCSSTMNVKPLPIQQTTLNCQNVCIWHVSCHPCHVC